MDDGPAGLVAKHMVEAETDLLRALVATIVQELMEAEVDAAAAPRTGSAAGTGWPGVTATGSGAWDTRVGSIELAIPRLRQGSYFPSWLLEPRRRAEQALVAVVAEAYVHGVSTRKVDRLVEALGLQGLSKTQVSRLCGGLDSEVAAFRERPLEPAPTRTCGWTRWR